jgi:hypothetical protein
MPLTNWCGAHMMRASAFLTASSRLGVASTFSPRLTPEEYVKCVGSGYINIIFKIYVNINREYKMLKRVRN